MPEEEYQEVIQYVKNRRPRSISVVEKLDILMLQGEIRRKFTLQKAKLNANRKNSAFSDASTKVATLLHRNRNIVSEVWHDYIRNKEFEMAALPGNRDSKPSFVPVTRCVVNEIQKLVRDNRAIRKRTVAQTVLDMLIVKGFVNVGPTYKNSNALRAVQRLLVRLGYKRGKKKGTITYRLKEENIRKRDAYVSLMTRLNDDGKRRIVYMDESYIHKNYCRHDDSLYDPNDEQDLETKAMHKGSRYCFIAAIIDEDK